MAEVRRHENRFASRQRLWEVSRTGKASLNGKKIILQVMLLTGVESAAPAIAQPSAAQTYVLVSGSQLVDDCLICDRPTIVVPLTGTFTLSQLERNTLYTRYELTNLSFKAGSEPGREYKVAGSGIYRIGGEVAIVQGLFLDVDIDNGFSTTKALCVSTNGTVSHNWPQIAISVDQTNGTPGQVYRLTLNAVPVPEVYSLSPDTDTGNLRLEWEANGGSFQVERALSIGGPFAAVTAISTNSSFTDAGVLTNHSQAFYRVRRF